LSFKLESLNKEIEDFSTKN